MTQLNEVGAADDAPGETEGKTEGRTLQRYFIGNIPFGFEVAENGMEMAVCHPLRRTAIVRVRTPPTLGPGHDRRLHGGHPCLLGDLAQSGRDPRHRRLARRRALWGRSVDDREDRQPGLSTVAGEIRFSDATTAELVAISYLTFMPSPRPKDQAPPHTTTMRTNGSMPVPFPEHVGVRVLSAGVAEVDLVRFTTQAAGTLQGGIVALVAEVAAESLTATPVLDLDVRYLNAVRVGPGRATAERVGENLVRVEVRDGGSDDRLAALVMARTAPP